MRDLHKDFFWIYGVIGGLAIREALTQTLHHALSNPAAGAPWILHLELWRTILFMLMIVRCYVGSVVFFNKVHGPSAPAAGNYYLDFIMGFTQFNIFYAWSITIFSYSRTTKGFSYFLLGMLLILLYDLLWLIFNWRYDTTERLKVLAVVNTLTALVSLLAFFAFADVLDTNFQVAEEAALIPAMVVAILSISDTISETSFFTKALESAIPKQVKPAIAPAPVTPPAAHPAENGG
jgi:hypothetical protein